LDAVSRWACAVNLRQYARGDLQSIEEEEEEEEEEGGSRQGSYCYSTNLQRDHYDNSITLSNIKHHNYSITLLNI
jgi:hypothetical protein